MRAAGPTPPVVLAPATDLAGDLIGLAGADGRHAGAVRKIAVGGRAAGGGGVAGGGGAVAVGEVARLAAAASLAVLLDPAAPEALGHLALPSSGDIVVVVGPEGGVSPTEAGALASCGAVRAHL